MVTLSRVLLTAPIIIFVALWVRDELVNDGESYQPLYAGMIVLTMLAWVPAEMLSPVIGVVLGGLFLLVAILELLVIVPDDWGKKPSE